MIIMMKNPEGDIKTIEKNNQTKIPKGWQNYRKIITK